MWGKNQKKEDVFVKQHFLYIAKIFCMHLEPLVSNSCWKIVEMLGFPKCLFTVFYLCPFSYHYMFHKETNGT
jgi:hypothetical protein